MKLKFFLTLGIFLLIIHPVFAQVTIKAEVNKFKISTDERLTYKLIIASSEANLAQPQIPKFSGFNILSQSQSTTLSLEKNGLKTSLIYEFILLLVSAGKLKIDPSTIKIANQFLSSEPFEIEVTQGKATPKIPSEESPALPQKFLPESEEPQVTL